MWAWVLGCQHFPLSLLARLLKIELKCSVAAHGRPQTSEYSVLAWLQSITPCARQLVAISFSLGVISTNFNSFVGAFRDMKFPQALGKPGFRKVALSLLPLNLLYDLILCETSNNSSQAWAVRPRATLVLLLTGLCFWEWFVSHSCTPTHTDTCPALTTDTAWQEDFLQLPR